MSTPNPIEALRMIQGIIIKNRFKKDTITLNEIALVVDTALGDTPDAEQTAVIAEWNRRLEAGEEEAPK